MSKHISEFPATKICSRCGEEKPRTKEYFYRSSTGRDGLYARCKDCQNALTRQWAVDNPDKRRENEKRYRQKPEAREKKYKYYVDHKNEKREYHRNWAQLNRDRILEKQRHWKQANPEKIRAYEKRWCQKNPEKVREKIRNASRRRRAREANAEGTHTIADMRRQYDSQKGKCWWCGKPVKWEDRHDDHLIPLNKGGSNWPNNIVMSCAHCNSTKQDKLPDEFMGRLF